MVDLLSFRGYSQPRDRTQVSSFVGGLFTIRTMKEAPHTHHNCTLLTFLHCPDGWKSSGRCHTHITSVVEWMLGVLYWETTLACDLSHIVPTCASQGRSVLANRLMQGSTGLWHSLVSLSHFWNKFQVQQALFLCLLPPVSALFWITLAF